MRQCGECTICCESLAVREIGKPAYTPCGYCTSNCMVFETAPKICKTFECAWRAGDLREEDRPDKVGVFFCAGTISGMPLLIAHAVDDSVYNDEYAAASILIERLVLEDRRVLIAKRSGQREMRPPVTVVCVMEDGSEMELPVEFSVMVDAR